MCQAGGFRRIVLAAGAHGDLRLEPGRLVVLRQVNLQAVVQIVNLDGHRVFRTWLVDSFLKPASAEICVARITTGMATHKLEMRFESMV